MYVYLYFKNAKLFLKMTVSFCVEMNENFSFFHILTKIGYDGCFPIINSSGWVVVSPSGYKLAFS